MPCWNLTSTIDAGSVSLMVSYSNDERIRVRQVLINGEWCDAEEILCAALIASAEEQIGEELQQEAEYQASMQIDWASERADQIAGMRV
jgi:hypothetical protein